MCRRTDDQEDEGGEKMTYELLVGLLALIAALIVVIKPIMNLNTSITELTLSVNQLKDLLDKLDIRVSKHGDEIDDLQKNVANHETRIAYLEKEN